MNNDLKEKVFEAQEQIVSEIALRNDDIRAYGLCIYRSFIGSLILSAVPDLSAVLQAGTAYWPRVKPEEDDGKIATHFGYQWDKSANKEALLSMIEGGFLPGMHTWIGLVKTQEVIDFSTGHLPKACKEMAGHEWTAPTPPKYMWSHFASAAISYEPDEVATVCAFAVIAKVISSDVIQKSDVLKAKEAGLDIFREYNSERADTPIPEGA